MTTDVLSDVLGAIRLRGAVYFDFDLSTPWCLEAPPWREIVSTVMPGAQRLLEYHLLARGECWAQIVGEPPPRRVRERDLIVFPHGDGHVLSSEPGMRASPEVPGFSRPSTRLPRVWQRGGGGTEKARVVCCFLGFDDRPFNPLLAALPRVLHMSANGQTSGWLATVMSIAAQEATEARAGGENVLGRLSELMFVETIRRHLDGLPASSTGWLAGLRDPAIARALAALHGDPKEPWTVDGLAREAGVSRSILAERFTTLVGLAPMQYLARWRMQLAARLLHDGAGVAAAARAVGYESEAAFARAFKKLVGQPPAAWRRGASRSPS